MDCPYCDEKVSGYDEFNLHVLKKHPEKTTLEDFKELKRARLWGTATDLTAIAFGGKPCKYDKVVETFKHILTDLMESGL